MMSTATRQVFNLEQVYLQIGDQYDEIKATLHLPLLDPSASLNPETAFRLGLITAFQYAEGLADSPAAQATIDRREWRYALHLPASHPGVPAIRLCRFRASLYFSTQAAGEFERMLASLRKIGLFSAQDSTQEMEKVVSWVCSINHFMRLKQSVKTVLSSLAASNPEWLRANAQPHWYLRYQTGRLDQGEDLSEQEMQMEAVRLGKDIQYLLKTFDDMDQSGQVDRGEMQILAQLFESEFIVSEGQITWRAPRRINCTCFGLGLGHTEI